MEITTEMLKEAKKKLEELEEKRIIPIYMGRYRFEVYKEDLDEFLKLFKKDKNLLKKLDKYFTKEENKKLTEDFFEFERLEYGKNKQTATSGNGGVNHRKEQSYG